MGYQPIWDAEFELGLTNDGSQHIELLQSIFRHKLMITNYVHVGPGGGNPVITLRGTQRQFLGWLADYYMVEAAEEGQEPADFWDAMKSNGDATCIA